MKNYQQFPGIEHECKLCDGTGVLDLEDEGIIEAFHCTECKGTGTVFHQYA